jgi:uncharacterized OB-fold protein
MRNLILAAAFFAIFSSGVIYAKSFDFTLDRPEAVGTVELPAARYRLELKGSTVTLTNTVSGERYDVPVKVTTAEKKFSITRIVSDTAVEPGQLRAIEFGGSKTRFEFGK